MFQVKPFAFYAFFFRNVLTYLVSWSYSYGFGALNPMPKEKMTKGKVGQRGGLFGGFMDFSLIVNET